MFLFLYRTLWFEVRIHCDRATWKWSHFGMTSKVCVRKKTVQETTTPLYYFRQLEINEKKINSNTNKKRNISFEMTFIFVKSETSFSWYKFVYWLLILFKLFLLSLSSLCPVDLKRATINKIFEIDWTKYMHLFAYESIKKKIEIKMFNLFSIFANLIYI